MNNQEFRRENAGVKTHSAMQQVYFTPNSNHKFAIRAWYHSTDRELPSLLGVVENNEEQSDESIRSQLEWEFRKSKMAQKFVLGFNSDELIYTDDTLGANSYRKVLSIQGVYSNTWYATNTLKVMSQLRHQTNHAKSTGFNGKKNSQIATVRTGVTWSPFKKRLELNGYLRGMQWNNENFDIIPLLGLAYRIFPNSNWNVRASFASNVNYPTINDRYWEIGGNPDLKTEKSEGVELGFFNNAIHITQGLDLSASANFYRNDIDNWIIWTPSGNYWSPHNIRKVLNQGVEFMMNSRIGNEDKFLNVRATYTYTESKDKSEEIGNGVLDKQLIYVPFNKLTSSLEYNHRSWQIWWRSFYSDEVFIDPLNNRYLPEYWIHDTGIQKRINLDKSLLNLRLMVFNVLDHQYQVLADRPMPGVNYKLSISLSI